MAPQVLERCEFALAKLNQCWDGGAGEGREEEDILGQGGVRLSQSKWRAGRGAEVNSQAATAALGYLNLHLYALFKVVQI